MIVGWHLVCSIVRKISIARIIVGHGIFWVDVLLWHLGFDLGLGLFHMLDILQKLHVFILK